MNVIISLSIKASACPPYIPFAYTFFRQLSSGAYRNTIDFQQLQNQYV